MDELTKKVERAVIQPLPCLVCNTQPEPAFQVEGGTHQPYGATMFSAGSGHYGSTAWDSPSRLHSLHINICDRCLVARQERVALVETLPTRPSVTYHPWKPGEEESDGD